MTDEEHAAEKRQLEHRIKRLEIQLDIEKKLNANWRMKYDRLLAGHPVLPPRKKVY